MIAVAKSLKKHRPCTCVHCEEDYSGMVVCAVCFKLWPCDLSGESDSARTS